MKRKSINKKIRERVYKKYDGHCAYCGCELTVKQMQIDHLEPFFLGGFDGEENYMPSCRQCNYYKNTENIEQFREEIKTLHERIKKYNFIIRLGIKYGIIKIKPFDGKFYFEKVSNLIKDCNDKLNYRCNVKHCGNCEFSIHCENTDNCVSDRIYCNLDKSFGTEKEDWFENSTSVSCICDAYKKKNLMI